jgi:HD-GYP domain-containing protein (c-di-GMP phosphodiesterase class II)
MFLKDLRKDPFLNRIPVVFIADSEDFRIVDQLRELGIKDRLVKPYTRNALLAALSKHINGRIERDWEQLPSHQRKALENTLSSFNGIADELAKGNPLPFGEISEACSAVVDVVRNNELGSLLSQIKDHDNFTYVHSLRFSALMALFGSAIGLPKEQQIVVASGGMVHDIGKMVIPRVLLNKEGTLSSAEWGVLRNHVTTAEKLISTNGAIPRGVATIVSHHHERLDGSGYPRRLGSADLNQLSRMSAIIDVFCALTDRRPYKRTLPPHVALETMGTDMNKQLDQDLLHKFKELLLDTGEGKSSSEPAEMMG